MDPELAQLCQTIDPADLGKRIRDARVAAGMTQAQLAGDDVSVAYISRIEDGQRRPDPSLVGRIAERTGVTLEELLIGVTTEELAELRFLVDQAELELSTGSADSALRIAETVLEKTGNHDVMGVRRAARRVQATALEVRGDLEGAIAILAELSAAPSPDAAWLRTLIALSRCHRERGDFARAIAVGDVFAPAIHELGLAGMTEAIQLTLTIANAYTKRGDMAHAMRMCKKAIRTADENDSPVARASAYWNASVIESESGSADKALDLARLAVAEFELGEDARNLGRLRCAVAYLQLALDPPDAAGALVTLEQAEREMAWAPTSTADLARQHFARGEAHLVLGDHENARAEIQRASTLLPEEAPDNEAYGHILLGRIAAAEDDPETARTQYRSAVHLLTGIGDDRGIAQRWFELGNLLRELGDTDGALDAFRRAAVSQGLQDGSRRMIRPSSPNEA